VESTSSATALRLLALTDLRVSDEQREQAAREIRDHFAAGRLTEDELSDRLSAAYRAKTETELEAIRGDLPKLPPSLAQQKAELAARRSHLQRRLIQQSGGGLAPFAICTVIWAANGASSFFWPVFVLLAVLLPLIKNGWALYGPAPELDRVEREIERMERHREHHAEHHARHLERQAARRDRRAR
jgi:hypothetical protein